MRPRLLWLSNRRDCREIGGVNDRHEAGPAHDLPEVEAAAVLP